MMKPIATGLLLLVLPIVALAQPADTKTDASLKSRQEALLLRLQGLLDEKPGPATSPQGAAVQPRTGAEAAAAREAAAGRLRALEESQRRAIERVPASIRADEHSPDAAAAAEIASEVEADEAEHYASVMYDLAVGDLMRRYPGVRAADVDRIQSVPAAYDDPDRFGIIFLHFASPGGGSALELDIMAYRDDGRGPRPAGSVAVWGAHPHDVRRGRNRVAFTTVTPRDSDPMCCPTGWTRFEVDTATLAVRVVATAE